MQQPFMLKHPSTLKDPNTSQALVDQALITNYTSKLYFTHK